MGGTDVDPAAGDQGALRVAAGDVIAADHGVDGGGLGMDDGGEAQGQQQQERDDQDLEALHGWGARAVPAMLRMAAASTAAVDRHGITGPGHRRPNDVRVVRCRFFRQGHGRRDGDHAPDRP